MLAAWKKPDLLKLVLDHGAPVDAVNHVGFTPLMIAVSYNAVPCVIRLLEAGASLAARYPDDGRSVVQWALEEGLEDITELLQEELRKRCGYFSLYSILILWCTY